jgi:hypothetical protein
MTLTHHIRRLHRLLPLAGSRGEAGTAAMEFALAAPVLVLACLGMVDIGMAFHERMAIDDSLRAASEGAMLDAGEAKVADLLKAAASNNFSIASDGQVNSESLVTSVDRFCACPESTSTEVSCTATTCEGGKTPYHYYLLSAEKKSSSNFLPHFGLQASLLVQVK